MKTSRRIVAVLAGVVMLLGFTAPPAAAAEITHSWHGNTVCPRPWLLSAYGPTSLCSQHHADEPWMRVGHYSPVRHSFGATSGWVPIYFDYWPSYENVRATDGIVGTFRGGPHLASGFGNVTHGVQYIYYLGQPVGRFGTFSTSTQRFHPAANASWLRADGPI